MKKVKRFLTALLCVCVLAGVMTTVASAVTILTIINLTVDAPAVGKKPADTASVPDHAHSVVKKVEWSGSFDSNGAFKAGEKYKLTVTMGIKSGEDWKFAANQTMSVKVNKKTADEAIYINDKELQVVYTFPKLAEAKAPTVLKEAEITLTAPETGKTPATTAKVPSDASYTVKKVEWTGSLNSGKFKEDTSYTANITLGIKSGKNAVFSDDAFDAYVNGYLIDEIRWNSETEIVVPAVFEKTDAPAVTTLNEIEITLTAPVTGKTPATTATVPSGAAYTVKKVEWKGTLDSGKFKASTEYTANITLGIKSGQNAVFPNQDIPVYVNNHLIDSFTWVSDTEIVVPAEFTKTDAAQSKGTAITKITLTVDKPGAGKKPATTATVPSSAHSVVQSVKWNGQLDTDGTFMYRTEYTVTVTLGIKSGANYYFSDKSINATVNGKTADEVLWYSDDTVEVVYTFPAFGTGSVINQAIITMDGPVVGEKPATTAHVPSTASTYVKSIRWEGALDSSGRFQAGTVYTAYLTLAMKDNGRKFSEKSFDATVNGVLMDEVTLVSDTELIIPVEFEKTPGTAPGGGVSKPSVVPTSQKLTVDGAAKNTEIYNIDGSNYFKLRDIAALLTGTGSQFSVDFDAARSTIVVKTGKAYSFAGGELVTGTDKSASAVASAQSIEINGKKVDLTAYNIGGNNFFKLRDLGTALNFDVDYDSAAATMIVKSK